MSEKPPTYVDFLGYRVDPAWRRLDSSARTEGARRFLAALDFPDVEVRPYLTAGLRADCDFVFWTISKDLAKLQDFACGLIRTELGRNLTLAHSWVAMTKPTPYSKAHQQHFEIAPQTARWLFIYPFTKTHEWYQLPIERRREMMEQHNEVGHRFPGVLINTCYSFGLGDDDFMLAFEADDPKEFSDLVQQLRESKARPYTRNDAPLMPCRRVTAEELIGMLAL
ncbi:MAG: chlorite dismutase family protein [Planctomycetes bacterium]|nr:chlorite dismutase family protein [Planctomycetota bacterium]